jgi:hypothetical protein
LVVLPLNHPLNNFDSGLISLKFNGREGVDVFTVFEKTVIEFLVGVFIKVYII